MELNNSLEALYNAVVVKKIEMEKTSGNIIVPDVGNGKNEFAEVISVGPGVYTQMGVLIEPQTKVGEIVLLPTMGFTQFSFEGETYYVGREVEVLARIGKK